MFKIRQNRQKTHEKKNPSTSNIPSNKPPQSTDTNTFSKRDSQKQSLFTQSSPPPNRTKVNPELGYDGDTESDRIPQKTSLTPSVDRLQWTKKNGKLGQRNPPKPTQNDQDSGYISATSTEAEKMRRSIRNERWNNPPHGYFSSSSDESESEGTSSNSPLTVTQSTHNWRSRFFNSEKSAFSTYSKRPFNSEQSAFSTYGKRDHDG